MVRARLASLTLAASLLLASGCYWSTNTCFPRLRQHFCGPTESAYGAPVPSGYGYVPGAECNCQGATSFHPAMLSPSPAATTAPVSVGPVMPTEGAVFPGGAYPVVTTPGVPSQTVAPPQFMTAPPTIQPSRVVPAPAAPSPYRPAF